MFADAKGLPYTPLRSLKEARSYPDGIAVLEGDGGGQIYVTVPAHRVVCSKETLRQLLHDLDVHQWAVNEGKDASIYYERKATGTGIAGGMGGGAVTGDLWVHPKLEAAGLTEAVRAVIEGRQARITK